VKRSDAEGVAKRYNRGQAEKAPLLAWAGLTPTTTADAVQERALAREALRFELDAEMAYTHVDYSVRADWHRYVVWTLVDAETFGHLTEWADRPRWGGAFMRLHRWRTAAELAMAGEDPLPSSGTVQPCACAPSLARAMAERRWHEEKAAHAAAGCTVWRCHVAARDRPAPFPATVEGGRAYRAWMDDSL
jgi:hypothetical protein